MNLSFAGCGFLGIYHVGVSACFRSYLPDLCYYRISGASAGAIAAVCLLSGAPLGEITSMVLEIATHARRRICGPFSPSFTVQTLLIENLTRILPDDVHLLVNGKVNISVTSVYSGENVILTHFNSKDELIQALLCSSFIPGFSGLLPPKFRGVRYMDGGITKNILILDENTVSVSPFSGSSHICPVDSWDPIKNFLQFEVNLAHASIQVSYANLIRLCRVMFPPDTETMSLICQQGFNDAKRFLERNGLIGCNDCVYSRWQLKPVTAECRECEIQQKEVVSANLPDPVASILDRAVEATNKAFMARIKRNPAVKVISLLSTPYLLPIDVLYAIVLRILQEIRYSTRKQLVTSTRVCIQETSQKPKESKKKVKVTIGVNLRIQHTYESSWPYYDMDSFHDMKAQNDLYENLVFSMYGQLELQNKC